jgi:hypothetical protein
MNLHRFFSRVVKKGMALSVFAIIMTITLTTTLLSLAVVAAETEEKVETAIELSNPISPDDFQIIAQYGDSYLAENSDGKKLLYLEGDAYQRGYAEGFLCPQSVERMSQDYLENVFFELAEGMGIELDFSQFPGLWNLLWNILKVMVASNQDAIPEEFRQEMQGITDACRDLGYDVSYRDLLTLNAGIDTLESVYVGLGAIFCNEFAVFDDATSDGRLYHGRDLMFPTGDDILSDESLIMVHNPTDGYPFVTPAAPALVGIPTGMNTQGVSCAMDVVYSIYTRPLISGEGCMLLCRKVTQYAGSLEEGIALIRDSDRAVPWLYLIADGEQPDAAVLETIASSILPPGDNLQNYLSRLLAGLLGILFPFLDQSQEETSPMAVEDYESRKIVESEDISDKVAELSNDPSCPELEKGVMVRRPDYMDPEWFDDPNSAYEPGDDPGLAHGFYPRQLESYPDLVAMTNHYIIPQMADTYPSLSKGGSSLWRYETMLGLLDEEYGDIDRLTAMWLIDFLNPARCDYYGTDTTQSIKGHHVLMDNHDLELWSLHGYYDTSWVHVDLMDILNHPLTSNKPPLADAGPDLKATVNQPLTFTKATCSDPDGDSLFCHWDFGEGGSANIVNPTYTYTAPGEYRATITANDDRGAAVSDSCTITVTEDSLSRLLRLLMIFLSLRKQ